MNTIRRIFNRRSRSTSPLSCDELDCVFENMKTLTTKLTFLRADIALTKTNIQDLQKSLVQIESDLSEVRCAFLKASNKASAREGKDIRELAGMLLVIDREKGGAWRGLQRKKDAKVEEAMERKVRNSSWGRSARRPLQ
ncbi:hypothetical protein EDC01DRAFT_777569 [Geopyxis carbonaria]|nr:hypothetical protein EDC01DRAFT_777569 [Geopyxis carbonaria]